MLESAEEIEVAGVPHVQLQEESEQGELRAAPLYGLRSSLFSLSLS